MDNIIQTDYTHKDDSRWMASSNAYVVSLEVNHM